MSTATAPYFIESFEAQFDDLLMRICTELQLDDARYKLAENSYLAVAKWLESHPVIAAFNPTMYPQGSMRLRTTVMPLSGEEYDLDFVNEFACDIFSFKEPVQALNLVEDALRASDTYKGMVERKNRCIRLNYQRLFHLDILPACRDLRKGGTCILVPDRRLKQWIPSNPKGFGAWFDSQAFQLIVRGALDKAEPVPPKETAPQKPPLKLAVQLLKRQRDIRYKDSFELAPPSIILTTLAGLVYHGEQSVAMSLGSILREMSTLVRSARPRIVVLNPTNQDEDLSERWDSKPHAYRSFVEGVTEFESQWRALLQGRGVDRLVQPLERLFGEQVAKRVIENQARDVEAARAKNILGVKKGSGLLTSLVGSATVPVRRNTFYGPKK